MDKITKTIYWFRRTFEVLTLLLTGFESLLVWIDENIEIDEPEQPDEDVDEEE